jgi:hypothetical protein
MNAMLTLGDMQRRDMTMLDVAESLRSARMPADRAVDR